ncbi:MAG TPA: glycoside hydrolase family 3 N-terminal domain-containing protein, partial [Candidatus Methylacidiphilales bacterium]
MIRRPFCRSTFPAFLLLLLALALCGEAAELPAGFTPPSVTQLDPQVEARVNGLLAQLTTEEKISLLSGTTYMTTQAIKRLGIPQLKFSDGPVGVRCWGQSTAYPADILLAATWDRDAAKDMGAAIGRDARARGVHVVLAPGTNIYREAQNGRNFEYVGEDPFLASAVVVNYIRGMQSQDVAACIKHFVANEEETRRNSMNVIVGRRALEEIYFPPFKAAINEGNVWTAMAAYNKVNGDWCTENKFLLTDTLRDQWHFQGLLMSDWGAVHNTLRDLNSGTDLEMDGGKPRKFYNAEAIKPLLASHAVSPQTLDEHVRRLLRLIVSMGFMDRDQTDSSIPLDDPQSAAVALKVASEGIVLLKNENKLLPLARAQTHRVVVLGPNAQRAVIGAGGSSGVNPFSSISALQAIQTVAGPGVQVDYISESIDALYPHSVFIPVAASGGKPGLSAEYFSNAQLEGTPVVRRVDPAIDFKTGNESPLPAIPQDSAFSIRWRGAIQPSETGDFIFAGTDSGGWRILLNGKVVTDMWTLHNHGSSEDVVPLKKNQMYQLAVEYSHPEGSAEMHFGWAHPQVSPAEQGQIKSADAVIYAGGFNPE